MSRETAEHPSNLLYRGEFADFAEAMDLVVAQCDHEAVDAPLVDEACRELGIGGAVPQRELLDHFAEAARRAQREWRKVVGAAERKLAAKMLADPDPDTRLIGEALLAGDLTTLAI